MEQIPQVNKTPKVSIVMPTYNQAEYLTLALDGIFTQTFQDYELIVVNDGSTDETSKILEEYQKKYQFTVIHQINQKLPGALNAGFRLVKGKYLTWTSSDNITLPNWLDVMVKALEEHPDVGLVYTDWENMNEKGELLGPIHTFNYDPFLLMRVNYIMASFLYRKECQDKLGLYNPEYIFAEDWEYWIRISHHYKLLHIPHVLYQYRYHSESLTLKHVRTQKKRQSIGYIKLHADFVSQPLQWYLSKAKWEMLRIKLKMDPRQSLLPEALDQ